MTLSQNLIESVSSVLLIRLLSVSLDKYIGTDQISLLLGKSDTVQCFSCRGYLHEWEEGDDPLEEHAKFFPK